MLSKADQMFENSHDYHFNTVYDYLIEREVRYGQLWLSVGYFLDGAGRHAKIKPWRNEEQLKRLKRDTDRE